MLDCLKIEDDVEIAVTIVLLERLWGFDFHIISDEAKAKILKEEFDAIMKKDTGLNAAKENNKQRTRETRLELYTAPTPAEVKNQMLSRYMDKVQHQVNKIHTIKEAILLWIKHNGSKFYNEVFEQWVLKHNELLTFADQQIIDFLLAKTAPAIFLEQCTWIYDRHIREFLLQLSRT